MINNEIIKIASNTTNVGLTNNYTYKCSLKNIMCGDKIKIELISKKSKINSMKYETESCIYCEASASLLSNKIKKITLKNVKKDLNLLKNILNNKNLIFPNKFKEFKKLIKKKNFSRINCINLPLNAVLKAIR